MNIFIIIFTLFSIINISLSQNNLEPTTVSGIISETTTSFYTPPTKTSTYFVTFTTPIVVQIITQTATPSTSIFISVTVANINLGAGKISNIPDFLGRNVSSINASYSSTAESKNRRRY